MTPAKHALPKQQPLAHEVVLQVHEPPTHSCPTAHSCPLPQAHEPPLQLSASDGSHATQARPSPPQFESDGVSQLLPLQQPVAHVIEQPSQALLTHEVPPLHEAHNAPPDPHAVGEVPSWQTPLASQQPVGQLSGEHTHTPPTQARPAPQGRLAPHMHAPAVQPSACMGLQV